MNRMAEVSSIVFWAISIIWICSAYGQGCDRFSTTRIPEAEPSSILEVDYFSCADGEFLTSVDVWYYTEIGELRWKCSDGKTSYFSEEFVFDLNYSLVTFDLGITSVETRFDATYYEGSSDTLVFFVDCYIGGYNRSSSASTSDRAIFSWSGPFGTEENYTEEKWTSSCPGHSFATGVTWWTPDTFNFVNGIQLECAELSSTCYPQAFRNQALIEKIQRADSTSSGIELGIVIVAAIGAAVPVVLVSVSVDDIDSTESGDNLSQGTTMGGIIIAVAIGSAAAVILVAVGIGLCFFRYRRRKTARDQDTEASPPIKQGTSRAPPLSDAEPRSFEPRARAPLPAYAEAPPKYESPPPYVSPGNARDA